MRWIRLGHGEDKDQSAQENPELKIARLCEGVRCHGALLRHAGILTIRALKQATRQAACRKPA